MNLRPDLLAVPAYHFTPRAQTVKLDQNESPYDLPADLKQQVLNRLAATPFNRYPDIDAAGVKAKLLELYDWSGGVVVAGGSNVLIQALVTAAGLGRSVLTVAPTFSVYGLQAELQGARLVECPLGEDFRLPLKALKRELDRGKGVFFLANPAAPTGNLFAAEALLELAEASKKSWLFVVDEAYHQFSDSDASGLVRRYPHVVSLRTLSKAFGLGGVRLGYALAQSDLAEQLQKAVMPFSVSALQLAVAETVLAAPGYAERYVAEAKHERARVFAALQNLAGVTPYPSSTNFVLFKVPDAAAVFAALLARDVVVRRQDHLPGLAECLRVSVGTPAQNSLFLEALGAVLDTVFGAASSAEPVVSGG